MQCMWFETEAGLAFERLENHARALKMLTWVDKHFETIKHDQFDFYQYCWRHMTLEAYTQVCGRGWWTPPQLAPSTH